MKLAGQIGERKVVVMIDIAPTHNFVFVEALQESGIPNWSSVFEVSLGNGEAVKGTGVCEQVVCARTGRSSHGAGRFSSSGKGRLWTWV